MPFARLRSLAILLGLVALLEGCELVVHLDRSAADAGPDAGCSICTNLDDAGDGGGASDASPLNPGGEGGATADAHPDAPVLNAGDDGGG